MKVIDHAGDQPFFVYLAHHAVHTPIEAKADEAKRKSVMAKLNELLNRRSYIRNLVVNVRQELL